MAEYSTVKSSKLTLKGLIHKKKKKKRKLDDDDIKANTLKVEEGLDTSKHGGFWKATKFEEISGQVAIEFGNGTYVKAEDDGTFTLGAPHNEGDGPSPEEIFTAIRINEDKIALKSGYDKYIRVGDNGKVMGRSDAVGAWEQWEPVFQDGKMALQSHTGCFMSVQQEDDIIVATSRKAGDDEIVQLRCQAERSTSKDDKPAEEKGNLRQVEINYVKKFQKFQDKKMRLSKDDLDSVRNAKEAGKLHESLLDRRSKMKADRYCK